MTDATPNGLILQPLESKYLVKKLIEKECLAEYGPDRYFHVGVCRNFLVSVAACSFTYMYIVDC
jgi:hypothetical protein